MYAASTLLLAKWLIISGRWLGEELPLSRRRLKQMQRSTKRWLFWTPRILCVLFAAFISVFALDVFGGGYGFWKTILALAIHLIPTAFLVLVLVISWRWEWVGGAVFPILGVLYIVTMWQRHFPWSVYAFMSGPLFLLGGLFLLNWLYRKQLRTKS